ncbi:high-affinity Zn(2+) transporter zrt1 [Fusarium irregulare]|uniref:High-affinity Zn(2+) transporter zrt1 n=1 Tax=Fusarium irregulare TaxID=2494466 RepID=A0A9W8Q0J4_9HYPO|nr:high-affinity Zn(2+) transporter zrt1 [Fusarium irregulare]KAJ4025105.1 high-affinity Zn(2+) transporter zrt1 [Fusarium irregulare]
MYTSALSLAKWGVVFSAASAAAGNVHIAPRATQAPSSTAAAPEVTAITGCHLHASDLYCFAGKTEYLVDIKVTATTDVPSQYTDCHSHGSDTFCVDSDGEEVSVKAEGAESEEKDTHKEGEEEHGHDHSHEEGATETGSADKAADSNQHCHFHAGVEHCTGGSGHGETSEAESGPGSSACQPRRRDYDVGLRVGLLFVILATGALGVFGPILLHKMMPSKLNVVLIVLKQFGTGIIISTAFVHLYTHAFLMFSNQCIGDLGYEATTSALAMAGIFLSFLVEYIGNRVVLAKTRASADLSVAEKKNAWLSTEVFSVLVMEVGILFHSLLIGLTLVVAGDEYFLTLFVVILFHQMFEGIALGSRIATIGTAADTHGVAVPRNSQDTSSAQDSDKAPPAATETIPNEEIAPTGLTMKKKLGLASLFAFITPIGMAIGIGVLQKFNGNDKSTLIAIGTLDAVSAGILMWVGLVEMWAADWMTGGHGHKAELAEANALTTTLAFIGLVAGLVVMSLLGKWA